MVAFNTRKYFLGPAALQNVSKIFMPLFKFPGFSRERYVIFLKSTKVFFNDITSRTFLFLKPNEYFLLSHPLVIR